MRFLSTPSARRATILPMTESRLWLNFYPRPPRGGRHSESYPVRVNIQISIHALREEGDMALCIVVLLFMRFLSTPSARRATTGP